MDAFGMLVQFRASGAPSDAVTSGTSRRRRSAIEPTRVELGKARLPD